MPGDYSRKTFDRSHHYSAVLKQQGRVQLDADDNEQLDIQHYRDETEAIDVIGQSGVPKKNDGFKIGIPAGGLDLTITAGRFYVDGLLCELDAPSTYTSQPYFPNPEWTALNSLPASGPEARVVSLINEGTYVVFLDAWQQEITALDDKGIREVALGGPDTTTRLQNVWQVKLLEVGVTGPNAPSAGVTCKSVLPEYDNYISPSTGSLNARTEPPKPDQSQCLLPPGTGYTRTENQLYRVEIENGGPLNQATFKWSRDNASVETTISNIAGNILTVADLGKDEILNFAPGQWVEIVNDESTLKGSPQVLAQIDNLGPGPTDITLKTSAATLANSPGLKLRRWDQSGTDATANGVSATLDQWLDLEDGVQVSFGTGNYRAGDYWLIPARTATGDIEWPRDDSPSKNPLPQPRKGVLHHYCRLALVEWTAGKLSLLQDCRKPFPPLTEICAVDVCFDNATCDFGGAKTVQDALDNLCRRNEAGQCTFVVAPGQDVQAVFNSIPPKGDAEICFQAGIYKLRNSVVVEGKGNLKISGVGFGTKLVAPRAEAALKFQKCSSVLVRDIAALSKVARAEKGGPTENLNGTLTFLNCKIVNVESVALRCGAAPSRAATCVTVRNDSNLGSARIQHCLIEPGHQQTGVLLVNVARSQVEDNVIRVRQEAKLSPGRLLNDRQHLANLRGLLIADARQGAVRAKRGKSNVLLSFNNMAIQFRTDGSLKRAWTTLLEKKPPPRNVTNSRALLRYVGRLATRLLLDDAFRKRFRAFNTYLSAVLQQQTEVVGSQGITVGGDDSTEVRIINNTVEGFLQGIHVGLSTRDVRAARLTRVVTIASNTILIKLPAAATKHERHAIFVGNCESLLIQNNNARLKRLPKSEELQIDGIRVWGKLGDRALVTQNHLANADGNQELSFNIGINLNPLEVAGKGQNRMWLVNFNVAPSRNATVHIRNGAQENNNVPPP